MLGTRGASQGRTRGTLAGALVHGHAFALNAGPPASAFPWQQQCARARQQAMAGAELVIAGATSGHSSEISSANAFKARGIRMSIRIPAMTPIK